MIYLVACLIAGEVILYLMIAYAARGRDPRRRPPRLGGLYLLLCVGLFGMSGASLLAYLDTGRRIDELNAAGQRYVAAAELLEALKDLELGERGYLLTGQAPYGGTYRAAAAALPARLEALRAAYAGTPERARAEDLVKLARIKAEEVAAAVALREAGDSAAAVARLEGDRAKNTMDLVRVSAGELVRTNLARYRAIQDGLRALARGRIGLAAAVSVGAVVQMALVVLGTHRAGRRPGPRRDDAPDE
jgi:CHASE3 domain sensor protein